MTTDKIMYVLMEHTGQYDSAYSCPILASEDESKLQEVIAAKSLSHTKWLQEEIEIYEFLTTFAVNNRLGKNPAGDVKWIENRALALKAFLSSKTWEYHHYVAGDTSSEFNDRDTGWTIDEIKVV